MKQVIVCSKLQQFQSMSKVASVCKGEVEISHGRGAREQAQQQATGYGLSYGLFYGLLSRSFYQGTFYFMDNNLIHHRLDIALVSERDAPLKAPRGNLHNKSSLMETTTFPTEPTSVPEGALIILAQQKQINWNPNYFSNSKTNKSNQNRTTNWCRDARIFSSAQASPRHRSIAPSTLWRLGKPKAQRILGWSVFPFGVPKDRPRHLTLYHHGQIARTATAMVNSSVWWWCCDCGDDVEVQAL